MATWLFGRVFELKDSGSIFLLEKGTKEIERTNTKCFITHLFSS
jgi:hypothetical protein